MWMDRCTPVLPENVFTVENEFSHMAVEAPNVTESLRACSTEGIALKGAVLFWYVSWCGHLLVTATFDSGKVLLCYAAFSVHKCEGDGEK